MRIWVRANSLASLLKSMVRIEITRPVTFNHGIKEFFSSGVSEPSLLVTEADCERE
jgi:hypothetical protein